MGLPYRVISHFIGIKAYMDNSYLMLSHTFPSSHFLNSCVHSFVTTHLGTLPCLPRLFRCPSTSPSIWLTHTRTRRGQCKSVRTACQCEVLLSVSPSVRRLCKGYQSACPCYPIRFAVWPHDFLCFYFIEIQSPLETAQLGDIVIILTYRPSLDPLCRDWMAISSSLQTI